MKTASFAIACLAIILLGCGETDPERDAHPAAARAGPVMQIQYLEIVTTDVDTVCASYARLFAIEFSEPVAALGNARTAELPSGGRIGVRAPMRETEEPLIRSYLLVDDIAASVKAAEKAGAQIALPPMELPGQGTCAIYLQGGIEHGLWQR